MEEPIISCDVSKDKSHIQGFIGLSNPVGEPFVVQHIRSELKLIKELANSLEKRTGRKPKFVFEFTGVYHESILAYVIQIGLEPYAISPLESAKVRKSNIRVTKTDAKDCTNIATVYYSRNIRKYEPDKTNAKALSRYKQSLREQCNSIKCLYRLYIDLVWPCLELYFSKIDGKIITTVIKTYHHPNVLKRRTSKQIAEVLENNGHCSYKRALPIADKLKDYASESVSGVAEDSEYVNCLIETLNRYIDLSNSIMRVELKLQNLLRKTTCYTLIKSIPGIGEVLASQIAAELGDYTRFKTSKQLVAFCGLDPTILQSGKDDGEHYSITRKGNALLRRSLYLAVTQMQKLRAENQITKFLDDKRKNSNLSYKAAVVASCRKLVSVIFGMLKNGTCFETR